jgi:hypothetical protein
MAEPLQRQHSLGESFTFADNTSDQRLVTRNGDATDFLDSVPADSGNLVEQSSQSFMTISLGSMKATCADLQ